MCYMVHEILNRFVIVKYDTEANVFYVGKIATVKFEQIKLLFELFYFMFLQSKSKNIYRLKLWFYQQYISLFIENAYSVITEKC